jgi:protein-S-isoprenylcysteine O-methyltransferase Ste14
MVTTVTAYALLALFFVLEGLLRQGRDARSLEAGPSDRGSTFWVGRAFLIAILALLLAPLLNAWGVGALGGSRYLAWLGVLLMSGGIALRVWASRTLGRFYTRTVRTAPQQQLVRDGPYRILRHPGYLGDIVMWAGATLATSNWLVVAVTVPLMFAAYCFRIGAEEQMLREAFGEEYARYRGRTWRLIPFLF